MNYLKYALLFVFAVELSMFAMSQFNPEYFVSALPQFNVESVDYTYPRLVGVLFLMLGLAKLYGALYITEKGAFVVSMWSWVVEFFYILSEVVHGQFLWTDAVSGLAIPPLMLIWSLLYYRKHFLGAALQ